MGARFNYGIRQGVRVHIRDLDKGLDRGLACGCVCTECGRELIAHLGKKQSWHFQHKVEGTACNPQPMTQLHAFVRDNLASRSFLTVPSLETSVEFEELGTVWSLPLLVQGETFVVHQAHRELQAEGVKPDVLYELVAGTTLALEVKVTHAVGPEKTYLLRRNFDKSIELDLSGLPTDGIGLQALEGVLAQANRWKWLHHREIDRHIASERMVVRWKHADWSPGGALSPIPVQLPRASTRLRQAQDRLGWAEDQLLMRRHNNDGAAENREWLGALTPVDRVAVACVFLGLEPETLPAYFSQAVSAVVPRAINHHGYSWQVVVFMKFGLGAQPFTAKDAAEWAHIAMPDRVDHEDGTLSKNGFTKTAARLHLYLRNLAAQGLLIQQGGPAPENVSFHPRFRRKADFIDFIGRPSQQALGAR